LLGRGWQIHFAWTWRFGWKTIGIGLHRLLNLPSKRLTKMDIVLSDPTALDASALSQAIHARQISCREVMHCYLRRIARLNPTHNAIVNLAAEDGLMAQAKACDEELAQGRSRGWLHGIPQAIKDTGNASGFPTTYGCSLLKSNVAQQDSIMTARMKAAGCIVIGKTNMPEFGLGSHTFNSLFGATPNAWDSSVSAGGSSGGAAVALAQRLLPVADGSDFMGSLRNPAAWNHVWGMRPTQGRVPFGPGADVWVDQLGTEGPMARSVADLAALLQTQSGFDPRQPLSIREPLAAPVFKPDAAALRGLRIGWLGDLNGYLAVEGGILPACEAALQCMQSHGAQVQATEFGVSLERVWQAWLVRRRALVGPKVAAVLAMKDARAAIKPEALWEHDEAQRLSFTDFMQASQVRSQFLHALLEQFERFDVLAAGWRSRFTPPSPAHPPSACPRAFTPPSRGQSAYN
jgi:amidase